MDTIVYTISTINPFVLAINYIDFSASLLTSYHTLNCNIW